MKHHRVTTLVDEPGHGPPPKLCASCGAPKDFAADDGETGVVFCRACAAPIADIEFPEVYLDLGWGG
jgi:hypothetical protein